MVSLLSSRLTKFNCSQNNNKNNLKRRFGQVALAFIRTKFNFELLDVIKLNFVLMKANATWPKRRFKLFLLLF